MERKNIAVIGAGVVGLSTALSVQEEFPTFNVTIFADKFTDDTLSAGAGGLFRPEENVHHDLKRVSKWCENSFSHFLQILKSSEASDAGMQLVSGYHLSSTKAQLENAFVQRFVPHFSKLTEQELALFPEQYKDGVSFTTIITDCRYYLPWMQNKFKNCGGKIVQRHISSLFEVPDEFDIIINCTGLGAKYLMHDDLLIPVRGQTIRVKAPWIKHFFYGDGVYVVPGVDYVILGGIKDYNDWSMNVNSYQKQYIWDKCTELVPSLKKAEVLWDWVGLRPYRSNVRVDANFITCNEEHKLVVNNYGHGGHGVTLSWGTAQEVTEIIKKIFSEKEFLISKL